MRRVWWVDLYLRAVGEVWVCLQPTVSLGGVALGLVGSPCWTWGLEQSPEFGREVRIGRAKGNGSWGVGTVPWLFCCRAEERLGMGCGVTEPTWEFSL